MLSRIVPYPLICPLLSSYLRSSAHKYHYSRWITNCIHIFTYSSYVHKPVIALSSCVIHCQTRNRVNRTRAVQLGLNTVLATSIASKNGTTLAAEKIAGKIVVAHFASPPSVAPFPIAVITFMVLPEPLYPCLHKCRPCVRRWLFPFLVR